MLGPHIGFSGNITLLKGWVRDAYNKTVLADVHVSIAEIAAGTTTNDKGIFMFSRLEPGTFTITIVTKGYLTFTQELMLDTGYHEMTFLLRPEIINIDPETEIATLNGRNSSATPMRTAFIQERLVSQLPANNTDDLLSGISNLNVFRPQGIFSGSAVAGMRGLPGSSRTLILLNGVPLNRAGDGGVNWNIIQTSEVAETEILKGPASAIYGQHAMGGVVNIISRKPSEPIEGSVKTFGGSMGSLGGSFNLGGMDLYHGQGVYWKLNGFVRRGDGYINEPEETRDSLDTRLDLNEYHAGMLLGYRFDTASTLDASYRYYKGNFGTGTKITDDEGSYDQVEGHLGILRYDLVKRKSRLNASVSYYRESLTRNEEYLGLAGDYVMTDSKSIKNDLGLKLYFSHEIPGNNLITAGADARYGDLDASQAFNSSNDKFSYGGKLISGGIFLQDEFSLGNKLFIVAGIRYDHMAFCEGSGYFMQAAGSASDTGLLAADLAPSQWNLVSPRLAVQYQLSRYLGIYASASKGFAAPGIDELSGSFMTSRVAGLANPDLAPEKLMNYEAGITWRLNERLALEPSFYYSRGSDFRYLSATGDSAVTPDLQMKPILQQRIIPEVEIMGAEISLTWKILSNLAINLNYSMNDPVVVSSGETGTANHDLTGDQLPGVPLESAYASLIWQNPILNLFVEWQYKGKVWTDTDNTRYSEPHHVVNLKLSKQLPQKIGFAISARNILNDMTPDFIGKLPPGRFLIAEISYDF